jgi:hypothetical protein
VLNKKFYEKRTRVRKIHILRKMKTEVKNREKMASGVALKGKGNIRYEERECEYEHLQSKEGYSIPVLLS